MWPSGPQEVIVTGSFDDWSKSLPLVKQSDGSFQLQVPLKESGEIFYKYVVDGEWLVNPSQRIAKDSNGIENNILEKEDFTATSEGSKIPEAGGLLAGAAGAENVKTTVMPSTEGQQSTIGEPGIFIPKDKDSLAAFTKFENTDPKSLNESEQVAQLSPEEKLKQKKKLKRTQYKLKKKKQAQEAKEAGASATTETSAETEEPVTIPGSMAEVEKQTNLEASTPGVIADEDEKFSSPESSAEIDPVPSQKAADQETETPLTSDEKTETIVPAAVVGDKSAETGDVSNGVNASQGETDAYKKAEDKETLDPTVVGVVGAAAGAGALGASATASSLPEIPEPAAKNPSIAPVIDEPIESTTTEVSQKEVVTSEPENSASGLQDAKTTEDVSPSKAVQESVPAAAIATATAEGDEAVASKEPSSKVAKEVDASPVHGDRFGSEEEIIITQGGTDIKAIEQQIMAHEHGQISVEEIQPTESEARKLAAEAHIPEDEAVAGNSPGSKSKPSAAETGKTSASEQSKPSSSGKSSKGHSKEKKKGGFMSKLKKIFK